MFDNVAYVDACVNSLSLGDFSFTAKKALIYGKVQEDVQTGSFVSLQVLLAVLRH